MPSVCAHTNPPSSAPSASFDLGDCVCLCPLGMFELILPHWFGWLFEMENAGGLRVLLQLYPDVSCGSREVSVWVILLAGSACWSKTSFFFKTNWISWVNSKCDFGKVSKWRLKAEQTFSKVILHITCVLISFNIFVVVVVLRSLLQLIWYMHLLHTKLMLCVYF